MSFTEGVYVAGWQVELHLDRLPLMQFLFSHCGALCSCITRSEDPHGFVKSASGSGCLTLTTARRLLLSFSPRHLGLLDMIHISAFCAIVGGALLPSTNSQSPLDVSN